jgi:hypothetical protein
MRAEEKICVLQFFGCHFVVSVPDLARNTSLSTCCRKFGLSGDSIREVTLKTVLHIYIGAIYFDVLTAP